jgi:histidine triad (HIT) family protein
MLKVVNLCITNGNKDKFLFIRRIKPPFKNHWGMLGGKVDENEHHSAAASRELMEESGIISTGSHLGTCFEKIVEKNKVNGRFEIYFYHFDVDENVNFKSGREGELKWFSLDELKNEKVIPSDPLMIDSFLNLGKKEVISVIHQTEEDYFQKRFCDKNECGQEGCVFCDPDKLHVLRESDNTRTFLSQNYLLKGHFLVIPKNHYESILDIPKEVLVELMEEVCIVKELLIEKLSVKGVDIRQHYRPFLDEGFLKVDHVHFHILPREFEDELYTKSMIYEKDIIKELNDSDIEEFREVFENE